VRDHIDPTYLPRPAVRLFRYLARTLPAYVITNSQSTLDRLVLPGAEIRAPATGAASVPRGADVGPPVGARPASPSPRSEEWAGG